MKLDITNSIYTDEDAARAHLEEHVSASDQSGDQGGFGPSARPNACLFRTIRIGQPPQRQLEHLHMINCDTDAGCPPRLGRTSLVTQAGAEPLSRAELDLATT